MSDLPLRIGRYRITDTLGEGGMGIVYAALDEQLDRPIALKALRHESAADPDRARAFLARSPPRGQRQSPAHLPAVRIGESEGQLFMAMERLEGEPLAARLGRGAMPLAEAVRSDSKCSTALEALHRRGITHRDLKPSNVFLTAHGAKVLDFGISLVQAETRRSCA